ncbi:IclR family transcriptional regulator domain-containing protein [Amycolatopsis rubida]|uniref:IclR-ED domain-containing protein n=1 Tax=Amycolatopsis rubida TaxID=112413 RepID=A0A1I5VIK6_9PSEU|nr:hypothetical protein [Amycolatopsis rubida]SFQ06826.1 hypothetical protein SAMN05421854_108351 [Amycolatopsis rubida]
MRLPCLHDLPGNIQLTALDGTEALRTEKISGTKAVPTMTRLGGRLPPHATGAGRAILAFSGRDLLTSPAGSPRSSRKYAEGVPRTPTRNDHRRRSPWPPRSLDWSDGCEPP